MVSALEYILRITLLPDTVVLLIDIFWFEILVHDALVINCWLIIKTVLLYISMTYYRKGRPPRCFFVDLITSLSFQLSHLGFPITGFLLDVNLIDLCHFSQSEPSYNILSSLSKSWVLIWFEYLTDKFEHKISFGNNVLPQSLLDGREDDLNRI